MTETNEISPISNPSGIKEDQKARQTIRIWLIIAIVVVLVLLTVAVIVLFKAPTAVTSQIRDVFIIFMALEFMVLGIALVILIIQLAKLVNLLENEVRPILKTTSETVNTLKGTTEFLSDNLVEPVIKLNSSIAGLKKVLDLLKIIRK